MDSLIPRLCADPLSDAEAVDPVDLVTERLMTGATSPLSTDIGDRLGCPRPARPETPGDRVAFHTAVLAALAARHLLGPEVVTASVIGPGRAVHIHAMVIARYVSWVSLVSVFLTDQVATPDGATSTTTTPDGDALDARTVDELDLAGITLTRADSPAEAVFGANLVIVVGAADRLPCPGPPPHLAKGALLVNASGHDLPPMLANQIDQVFVDDLSLVGSAAAHGLARPAHARIHPQPCYRLVGDLRQVVRGEHVGRTDQEQVLLVELLSSAVPAPR
ncbi:hypothetical protein O7606_00235 [Micromonospora sp. WMMD882]|uniref:hypothetical protein n=1 Tax=Micromonospora sp. WMMD882 TaxID=3015151 RepID=UPI00248C7F94|nr:hypothetical protein [Micromonospora sp. WMMD882]WBB79880.1 hypothetical protein O7606_00235 [Micromonospora sp. WMMD882]